ncbi:MAG: DUF948 domain-containing protein [Actinobacteria bacterium]|nr:DUF948 domain-containing protein [Actinomycetota bacterium]
MSGGQIAALIAAAAFVLLVGLLAVPILKLGRALDEATLALRSAREGAVPILTQAASTVEHVNGQLERVDGITANAEAVSTNVAALTSAITGALGGPVVKVAAFSYGVRRAVLARRHAEEAKLASAAARRDRRARRRARRG